MTWEGCEQKVDKAKGGKCLQSHLTPTGLTQAEQAEQVRQQPPDRGKSQHQDTGAGSCPHAGTPQARLVPDASHVPFTAVPRVLGATRPDNRADKKVVKSELQGQGTGMPITGR